MSAMLHPREQIELFGHEETEKQLLQLITQQKVPNAVLITGPKGVGKATLAYRIARYVLAGAHQEAGGALFGPETLALDAEHPIVSRINAESHPDLLVLEGIADEKKVSQHTDIKIEHARKVGEFLSLTPAESRWRVVLIDCADDLTVSAANSLLKQLEEPPAQALMILVSHNPGRLLPTIRSRCRQSRLHAPSLDEFTRIVSRMDDTISLGDMKLLYVLSRGAPGSAMQMAAQQAPQTYQTILDLLRQGEDVSRNTIMSYATRIADKKMAKEWPGWQFIWHTSLSRIISAGNGTLSDDIIEGECMLLERIAARMPITDWMHAYSQCEALLRDTDGSYLDKKQTIIQIFDSCSKMSVTA